MTRRSHPDSARVLSRRSVLLGGSALAVLAACSSNDDSSARDSDTAGPSSDAGASPGKATVSLVAFFGGPGVLRAGIPQRMTFGLGDAKGTLLSSSPAHLEFTIADEDGKSVVPPITVARHAQGLPRAYYPVPLTAPRAGTYRVSTRLAGKTLDAAVQVDAPDAVPIPQAGEPMPALETPTTADARGVDPICTRDPICPFHQVSLAQALSEHRPVALLISTPAYCQVAICGPVLDVLVGQQKAFDPQVAMIHAEVYQSGKAAAANIASAEVSATVKAFKLPFEPSLILARADGTIAQRLDTIFDQGEVAGALGTLTR